MFVDIGQRFFSALDTTMRHVVDSMPDSGGLHTLVCYPLGWVDAQGNPSSVITGKRIRPLLTLLSAEAVSGNWRHALPAAAAVELLHNFSLIHDDIEDASEIRHNRPTVWKVWGTATAINAGDALFSIAYTALEFLKNEPLPPEIVLEAWSIFNRTNLELTRGQHLDIQFETRQRVSVDDYISMISGKSAALVAASAQLGALVGSCKSDLAACFADFGLNLGLAFQIRDDILGIWGDPAVTGKSAASDIVSRKKSLPVLIGLQRSPELESLYAQKSFVENDVAAALGLLNQTKARDTAETAEAAYFQKALAALDATDLDNPAVTQLREIAQGLVGRDY